MNVMHILGSLGPGGAEIGVIRLIKSYNTGKIRHSVCAIGSDITLMGHLPPNTNSYSLGIDGACYTAFIKLFKLLKRTRTEIAHVNNLAPWFDVALAAKLAGSKCIQTFHGIEENIPIFPRWRRIFLRAACMLTSSITTVGETVSDRLVELTGISRSRMQVIHNGVDTSFFKPCSSASVKRSLRIQLALPPDGILIGCIAAFRPVKDHAGLLKAFAKAMKFEDRRQQNKDLCLVLAGDGPLLLELKALSKQLGIERNILFIGRRNDVDKILQALDVFILSSKTEGISYAILEAMASGLPVIATDVGGNKELISHGCNGYLVPRGDVGLMAHYIASVRRNSSLMSKMGRNGREKVLKNYSLKGMVSAYKNLYQNI
jgi:sugar transferase (PEP-CTERM/EpsH1 system associated)